MNLVAVVALVASFLGAVSAQQIECVRVQAAASQLVSNLAGADGCGISFQHNKPGMGKNLAAMWLRNIFHDGGSWNEGNFQFGLDGSIINEVLDSEASGLGAALPIQAINGQVKVNPLFSTVQVPVGGTPADLISIAGMAAIKHCNGPEIPVSLGLNFAGVQQDDGVQAGLIPTDFTLGSNDLFNNFFSRMGFQSKAQMFTLITGSHSIGGVHRTVTPEVAGNNDFVAFDPTPNVFDNQIFKKLLANPNDCVLPIDCNMAKDPELQSTLKLYANDQNAFFSAYTSNMTFMLSFNTNRFGVTPQGGCPLKVALHNYRADTAAGNATIVAGPAGPSGAATSVRAATSTVVVPPTPTTTTTTGSAPSPSVSPLKIVFNIDSNKNYFDTVNDVSGGILKTDRPTNIFYNMDRAACVGNDIAGTRSAFLGINNADKTNLNDFVRLIVNNNVGTATIPASVLKAGSVTMYITCHGSDGKSTYDSNFGNNWPFSVASGL